MGISTSFYANLERGNKGVSISVLYDLANCLGVSVDYLIYPNQADARIRNIETLLRDKPESFIIAVERLTLGQEGYNMSLNQEEEEYIERLYREMYTRLCIYAMSALGSKALAEEVVQDTFRIACIKPDGLMSSKNPRGWLINTLKNVIRNRRRTEARLSNALLAAMSAYEPQASTTVETTEFIVAYSDALGEEDFQLLVNIVVRRYTMLEAAEELGITVEACKKRVQRAKKKLQKIIEKDF